MHAGLAGVLRAKIEATGPMPFAAFMSLALYHPRLGYYSGAAPRTGWRGHFVTSAEVDPAFGELWARGFEQIWRECGAPARFDIVEIGPGEGSFAAAALASMDDRLRKAVRYHLVERAPAAQERQRDRLAGFDNVAWLPSVTELPAFEAGCVFANEVLDNLPVHLVEMSDGSLKELCVAAGDDGFFFVSLPPSSPELAAFLARCGVDLPQGHRFEVTLAAESLAARCARTVGRGAIVFVDYGATAEELVQRPEGSLLAYSGAGVEDDVLSDPGDKDITAHANWTALERALCAGGAHVAGPLSQRAVLHRLGAGDLDADLKRAHEDAVTAGEGAAALGALSRRQALGALTDPGGLGSLEVVAGLKGIKAPAFLAAES